MARSSNTTRRTRNSGYGPPTVRARSWWSSFGAHGSTSTAPWWDELQFPGGRCRCRICARRRSTPICSAFMTRAGDPSWRFPCCGTAESSALSWCGEGRPAASRAETCELLQTFAGQSALAILNARLFRELERKTRRARGGRPAQVGVPGEHVARASHAPQRRDRLLRGAARAHVRRSQRATGRVSPRHPELRKAPPRPAERHPRPVEGRGRSDGSSAVPLLDTRRAGRRDCRWCGNGRCGRGSRCGSRRGPAWG